MYLELQEDIRTRLNNVINTPTTRVEVVNQPNTEAEFARPAPGGIPRLVIAYVGSTFGDPISTDQSNQEETVLWSLDVCSMNLREIYPALVAAKLALVGYAPRVGTTADGCHKIYLRDISQPQRGQDSIWWVKLDFACVRVSVEVADPALALAPILTQLTVNPPTII